MKPQYAGALLLTTDNKIILQQRDNKPEIMNPGQITFFGGSVEEGETPDEAIVRELQEELGLTVSEPKLYKIFQKTKALHGEDREMHIYVLRSVRPASLQVAEGKGFILISKNDNLLEYNLTAFAREVVSNYFLSHPPGQTKV